MSYVQRAIEELAETLQSKNEDYRIGGEFSNFQYAADSVGGGMDAATVMRVQIGIKLGRILGQSVSSDFNNESFRDSVKDLAGYAIILYAYLMSEDGVEENCHCDSCKSCRSEDPEWGPNPFSEEEF